MSLAAPAKTRLELTASLAVPAKTWPKKQKANAAPASDDDKGMCSDVLLQVHEALKTIREHKVFDKIEETKPLTIAQGGQQAVFDAAQCTKALSQENNKYKCSGNFFWQDLLWLANHRVPMNAGQINQIQKYDLPPSEPPKFFPYEVIVAVESADEIKPDGGWPRLSPAEPVFALLFSVQECIQARGGDATLKRWKQLFLTVPFEFEVVPAPMRRGKNVRRCLSRDV